MKILATYIKMKRSQRHIHELFGPLDLKPSGLFDPLIWRDRIPGDSTFGGPVLELVGKRRAKSM